MPASAAIGAARRHSSGTATATNSAAETGGAETLSSVTLRMPSQRAKPLAATATAMSVRVMRVFVVIMPRALRAGASPSSSRRVTRQPRLTRGDETALVGEDDRLHAVAQAELGQHVGDVGLDRVLAEHELRGDLGVGQAAGDEAQHLELARGELGGGGGDRSGGGGLGARELLDEPARD